MHMRLLLDNSQPESLVLFYERKGKWRSGTSAKPASGDVVKAMSALLARLGETLAQVTGIAVVVGRGSFTAMRVATTVVNTLALALHIPAAGIPEPSTMLAEQALFAASIGQYVLPAYSGEARIGKKIFKP